MEIIKEKYGILLQSEDLIGLKTQLEIILGLPKNCAKHLILNKIKNLVTSSNGAGSAPEIGMSIEDTEKLNNSELLVEINMLFDSIKSSLKLPKTTNYTQCLKAMKKIVSKRTFKANDRHEKRKTKNKYNASKVALNSTKIDLSKNLSFKKKTSPSREISPAAMYSCPSSARNNSKYSKIVYPSVPFGEVPTTRLQPTQKIKRPKRTKKGSTSTSVQKRSPIIKKTKAVK